MLLLFFYFKNGGTHLRILMRLFFWWKTRKERYANECFLAFLINLKELLENKQDPIKETIQNAFKQDTTPFASMYETVYRMASKGEIDNMQQWIQKNIQMDVIAQSFFILGLHLSTPYQKKEFHHVIYSLIHTHKMHRDLLQATYQINYISRSDIRGF